MSLKDAVQFGSKPRAAIMKCIIVMVAMIIGPELKLHNEIY